ncbi:hypothetical protein Tco_0697099 [Tanacetum coccineum]
MFYTNSRGRKEKYPVQGMEAFEDCVDSRVPRELSAPLFHLKCLSIDNALFTCEEELILALLINSSPNLEKLKISDRGICKISTESSSRVNCHPGIMLEHLNELEIKKNFIHETRLDFVKLILARSSVLKKVRILPQQWNYRDKKLQFSEILSPSSRASPEVQIVGSFSE